jgi:hypothetical protein
VCIALGPAQLCRLFPFAQVADRLLKSPSFLPEKP